VTRPRVVIAGMGDTGVLTGIALRRRADVVGIATKPGLVSGQELGLRLARPDRWARDYRIGFDRFRGLDDARILAGHVVGLDTDTHRVAVRRADGTTGHEPYDALVVATGVTNGFWRRPMLEDERAVDAALEVAHRRLASARHVVVVGGGAAAVGSAAQIAARWPATRVDLYFPGDRALPRHHRRVWERVAARLRSAGVDIHPGHRAIPPDRAPDLPAGGTVEWSTGQPPVTADAVLWAIGHVRPNTSWLPDRLLDDDGFVRVNPHLQVVGPDGVVDGVFAVGDVAATDPLRTSARNRGHRVVAHNVRAAAHGRPLASYRPPRRRWGSVLGPHDDGLEVFAPDGRPFRFPAWSIDTVLQPWIVRRGIYRGVRTPSTER
jgi:NADH dehydrogenase FAD-containing subunit